MDKRDILDDSPEAVLDRREGNISTLETTFLETHDSIVSFANEAWNNLGNAPMRAARVNEIAADIFLRYCEADGDVEKIRALAPEVADVFIGLCLVADLYNLKMIIVPAQQAGNHFTMTAELTNFISMIVACTVDENRHIQPFIRKIQEMLSILAITIGEDDLQTLVNNRMTEARRATEDGTDAVTGFEDKELAETKKLGTGGAT